MTRSPALPDLIARLNRMDARALPGRYPETQKQEPSMGNQANPVADVPRTAAADLTFAIGPDGKLTRLPTDAELAEMDLAPHVPVLDFAPVEDDADRPWDEAFEPDVPRVYNGPWIVFQWALGVVVAVLIIVGLWWMGWAL